MSITGDLFNNPMSKAAFQALDPKDIKRYKEIGKSYYENINFEKSQINNISTSKIRLLQKLFELFFP